MQRPDDGLFRVGVGPVFRVYVSFREGTLPKTNGWRAQNGDLEKVTGPFKHGIFWYQFVRFQEGYIKRRVLDDSFIVSPNISGT